MARTFECPECGTDVPSKTRYCVNCDQKVDNNSKTTADEDKIRQFLNEEEGIGGLLDENSSEDGVNLEKTLAQLANQADQSGDNVLFEGQFWKIAVGTIPGTGGEKGITIQGNKSQNGVRDARIQILADRDDVLSELVFAIKNLKRQHFN
jgi:hypothetical protein